MNSILLKGHTYTPVSSFKGYKDDRVNDRYLVTDADGGHRLAIVSADTTTVDRRYQYAAEAAARLEDYDAFADCVGHGKGQNRGQPRQVWLEKWVTGSRLKDLLRGGPRRFTLTDLQQLAIDLAEALSVLRAQEVEHGQISVESLILAEPAPGVLSPTSRFKIVNLAYARHVDGLEFSAVDDMGVLRVLVDAHNELMSRPDLPREVRIYLRQLRDYLLLAGRGVADGKPLDPMAIRRLGASRTAITAEQEVDALRNPFDFLSAEHFSSEALLHRVFTDSCPWIEEVGRPVPTLIEGPRGCGKSMVLRWLSVRTQLAGPDPTAACRDLQVAGFYVACASEVQSRVARFNTVEAATAVRAELVHYLNMVLLREVATTLLRMSAINESTWGLTEDAASALYAFVAAEVKAASTPAAGVDLWEQARDLALNQLTVAHEILEGGPTSVRLTGASFLHDLARTLTERVPFFTNRRVAYCLDDYSSHRIPDAVQQVFNEVVFNVRSGNHVFKISAENRGFYPFLLNGARVDSQREMTQIDFGTAYLEASNEDKTKAQQFASDLLHNRLVAAGWAGTPDQLLGTKSISDAEFARLARAKGKPKYAGLETITDLCTGDIANLLFLYKNIFDGAGVTPDQTAQIPDHKQDEAIRATSRALLENVRSHVPYGPRMLTAVDELCKLSSWALMDAPEIKEHGQLVPRRQTRIEVDGLAIPDIGRTDLTDDEKFFVELLRRAVLIELRPGVSRHGPGSGPSEQAVRLMLRRIFLPAYGLSLGKNLSWNWTQENFARFLENPVTASRSQRARIMQKDAGSQPNDILPGLE